MKRHIVFEIIIICMFILGLQQGVTASRDDFDRQNNSLSGRDRAEHERSMSRFDENGNRKSAQEQKEDEKAKEVAYDKIREAGSSSSTSEEVSETNEARETSQGLKEADYSAKDTAEVLLNNHTVMQTTIAMFSAGYSYSEIKTALIQNGQDRDVVNAVIPVAEDEAEVFSIMGYKEEGKSATEAASALKAQFSEESDDTGGTDATTTGNTERVIVASAEEAMGPEATQEERTVITMMVEAGYSADEIKSAMKEAGYDAATIDKMLPQSEQQGVLAINMLDDDGNVSGVQVISTKNDGVTFEYLSFDEEAGERIGYNVQGHDANGNRASTYHFDAKNTKLGSYEKYGTDTDGNVVKVRNYDGNGTKRIEHSV